jgi:F0F1-type ATP synthase gamma subunit
MSITSRSETKVSDSCPDWGANIISQVVQLGDRPRLDKLTGPVKVLLDKYVDGTVDEVISHQTCSSTR